MIPVLCIFHFSIFPFFIAFFTKFWIYTKKNIDASQRQFVKLTIVSVIGKLTVNP
jgi:hypothetical protein